MKCMLGNKVSENRRNSEWFWQLLFHIWSHRNRRDSVCSISAFSSSEPGHLWPRGSHGSCSWLEEIKMKTEHTLSPLHTNAHSNTSSFCLCLCFAVSTFLAEGLKVITGVVHFISIRTKTAQGTHYHFTRERPRAACLFTPLRSDIF